MVITSLRCSNGLAHKMKTEISYFDVVNKPVIQFSLTFMPVVLTETFNASLDECNDSPTGRSIPASFLSARYNAFLILFPTECNVMLLGRQVSDGFENTLF